MLPLASGGWGGEMHTEPGRGAKGNQALTQTVTRPGVTVASLPFSSEWGLFPVGNFSLVREFGSWEHFPLNNGAIKLFSMVKRQEPQKVLGPRFSPLGSKPPVVPQCWPCPSEWQKGSVFWILKINQGRIFMLLKKQIKRSAENVKILQDKLSFKRDNCVDILVTARFHSLTERSRAWKWLCCFLNWNAVWVVSQRCTLPCKTKDSILTLWGFSPRPSTLCSNLH